MQRRGPGGILLAVALVAGVALGASAATGKLPFVTHAWDTVTSSVVASLPSSVSKALRSPDTNAGDGGANDAGAAVHRQTAPLSSSQLAAPLVRGTFVNACGAPENMKVVVDATVKMGHAVDVAVKADPPNPTVAACVERAIRGMRWDISPKTDRVTVTY